MTAEAHLLSGRGDAASKWARWDKTGNSHPCTHHLHVGMHAMALCDKGLGIAATEAMCLRHMQNAAGQHLQCLVKA